MIIYRIIAIVLTCACSLSWADKLSSSQLNRAGSVDPESLDPQKLQSKAAGDVARDLFEGLVSIGPKGTIIPAQASHWTISEDRKCYRFTLRDSLKWSDGKPLTSNDFVFAYRRAVSPAVKSPYAWYFNAAGISNSREIINGAKPSEDLGVIAIDNKTIEIELIQPLSHFLNMLPNPAMFPVPEHTIIKHGDNWVRPGKLVSNGAYTLTAREINERIILERNRYYWNDVSTKIDRINYLFTVSLEAQLQKYSEGELHLTSGIPNIYYKKLLKQRPRETKSLPQLGLEYLAFNLNRAPFDDVRIRKALSYAIDRKVLVEKVMPADQPVAYGLTPRSISGFTFRKPDYELWGQKERQQKARKLLKQAGYSEENPLRFTLLYNKSDLRRREMQTLARLWEAVVPVDVVLVEQSWKKALINIRKGEFDIARANWLGDYDEPSAMLNIMITGHAGNKSGYASPEYEQLMEASRNQKSNRQTLYQEAEDLLMTDMPLIPLYLETSHHMVKPALKGYDNDNPMDIHYSRNLYWMGQ